MKKADALIVNCPKCLCEVVVPLQQVRMRYVPVEPEVQIELSLEGMAVTDGSEGAESEEEISQTKAA